MLEYGSTKNQDQAINADLQPELHLIPFMANDQWIYVQYYNLFSEMLWRDQKIDVNYTNVKRISLISFITMDTMGLWLCYGSRYAT